MRLGELPCPYHICMTLFECRSFHTQIPNEKRHGISVEHADFIECACGHLSVNKVDRSEHLREVLP